MRHIDAFSLFREFRSIDFIQYFKLLININPPGTVIAKSFSMSRQEDNSVHPFNLERTTKRFQRDHIQNVLEATNWDLETAAKMLGIGPDELKKKMVSYGISKK